MINRRRIILLGGSLLGAGLSTGLIAECAIAAEPSGQVTSLIGSVQAVTTSIERDLAMGAPVQIGDIVRTKTGSRVGLSFGKTIIRLGPSSTLKIEKQLVDAGDEFELLEGSMYFEHVASTVRKATVRSPYGLIAVRGTKFLAGTYTKGFGVFVAEGQVEVTGGGKTVRLSKGLGTDIAKPGSTPVPPRAWPAARVRQTLRTTLGAFRLPK
jgi:ferric-dicitrate binding protein FerR (iron transport regulator)